MLDFLAGCAILFPVMRVIDKLNNGIESGINLLIELGTWVENSLVALGERFEAAFDRAADKINK